MSAELLSDTPSESSAHSAKMVPKPLALEMLRRMLLIRIFEEHAVHIRTTSDAMPGFVHIAIGQEAEIVGACLALRQDDYITGNHRSHGHPIAKGAELGPLMAELLGKKTGVCRGKGGSMHLASFAVGSLGESGIVGSLMPVAVGAGLSAQMRGTDQVCLCFFGDGGANCGPFHESLNLAAIWRLPVIFLCENNGYATTTSQTSATAVPHIASRADAYGIPGNIVDGQNVIAVYESVSAAVRRARAGDGPTLIEAKTYRYREHAEFEMVLPRYRSEREMSHWLRRDPIDEFTEHLLTSARVSGAEVEALRAAANAEVEAAVEFAESSPMPGPEELLQHLFK